MPKKPIAVYDDFNTGIAVNPDKGYHGMYGFDIFALPGALLTNYEFQPDDDTAITTNDDPIVWFEIYDENGLAPKLYGYDNYGVLYVRESGTWTELRDTWQSNGHGLKAFGTSLYYLRRDYLGKLTGDDTVGGNYNDTFKSIPFSFSLGDYGQMVVFAGSLYIPNGRYVSKLDSDETTFTSAALTLAVGYEIRSATVWNDYIVLGTKSSTRSIDEKIVLWDGTSDAPNIIIDIPKPGVSALFNWDNLLLAFIGDKIYYYTGSDFAILRRLPKTAQRTESYPISISILPGAVTQFGDRILFAATSGTAQFPSGVYALGRPDKDHPIALTLESIASTGELYNITIGALSSFGTLNGIPMLYLSYEDAHTAGVDVRQASALYRIEDSYLISPVLTLPEAGGLVQGVRIRFMEALRESRSVGRVTVYYRVDTDIVYHNDISNWTELGEIDNDPTNGNDNMDDILYGLCIRPDRIQFKFVNHQTQTQIGGVQIAQIEIY